VGYDRRAGQFDNRLARAVSDAKSKWGTGWKNLSEDQQNAYVCQAVCAEIGGIDWDHLSDKDAAEVVQKLTDISALCTKALQT
jgi:hypothetical protein